MTRKLKSELKTLRQQASVEASDDDVLRLLVELVARRDALFYVWRPVGPQAISNYPEILDRQRDYLDGVRGIEARAGGRSEWKTMHYLRRQLVDAGFTKPITKSGQIASLLVTERGDAVARAVVDGEPSMPDTALLIYELLQRKPYQSESHLFARELYGDPAEWVGLTELVMPLLVRGVVAQTFDMHGRVFYFPTAREMPEVITSNEPIRPWAFDLYCRCYHEERQSLATLQYEGNEVFIPLPATGVGNTLASPYIGREYAAGEYLRQLRAQPQERRNHAGNP